MGEDPPHTRGAKRPSMVSGESLTANSDPHPKVEAPKMCLVDFCGSVGGRED